MAIQFTEEDRAALRLMNESFVDQSPQADKSRGALGDVAVATKIGLQRIPGIATGLADIGAGLYGGAARSAMGAFGASDEALNRVRDATDRPFSRAADALGERTGFQPSQWGDATQEQYSPQMDVAQANTQAATQRYITDPWTAGDRWGAVRGLAPVALEYLKNPRAIQAVTFESLPSTVVGGLAGAGIRRGAGVAAKALPKGVSGPPLPPAPRMSAAVAGGIGEGLVISGMVASEIDESVDPARMALAATGAGLVGGAIGAGGAVLSGKLGLIDIDSSIAGGRIGANITRTDVARSWPTRIAGGALFEGLQEIPQEGFEQIATNWAEGKPLLDGVLETTVPAALAGGAMGGGINLLSPRSPRPRTGQVPTAPVDPVDPAAPAGPDYDALSRDQLLEAYKNIAEIAKEAAQYPEIVQQATSALAGLQGALTKLGVPQAAVDLEQAQERYATIQQKLGAARQTMAKAVYSPEPQRADKIAENIKALQAEAQQLQEIYGDNVETESMQVARLVQTVAQEISADTAVVESFQKKDGTPNKQGVRAINEALALSDTELAAAIVADTESTTGWSRPKLARAAVARKRGLTADNIQTLATTPPAATAAAPTQPGATAPTQAPTTPTQPRAPGEVRTVQDFLNQETFDDDVMGFQTGETAPAAAPRKTPAQLEQEKVLRSRAGLTQLQRLEDDQAVAARDYQALFAVVNEIANGASIDNIIEAIRQRTATVDPQTGQPVLRDSKTIRGNILAAINAARVSAGLEPQKTLSLKRITEEAARTIGASQVVGADLAQEVGGDLDTEVTAPIRTLGLAEEVDNEFGAEVDPTTGEISSAEAAQAGIGIINTAGGSQGLVDAQPKQVSVAKARVTRLTNQIQELEARVNKESTGQKRDELIGDLVAKQDALVAANEQLAELTGVMAQTEPTAEQRAAEQAAWAEENAQRHSESERTQILAALDAIGEVGSERTQRAANAWEQMRESADPAWEQLINNDVVLAAAWVEVVDGAYSGALSREQVLYAFNRIAQDAVNATGGVTFTEAQEVANAAVRRPVQQPASTNAAGTAQQQERRPRLALTPRTQPAQGQAPAAQAEVTPNAAPVRENQGRPDSTRGAPAKGQANRRSNVQPKSKGGRKASDAEAQKELIRQAENVIMATRARAGVLQEQGWTGDISSQLLKAFDFLKQGNLAKANDHIEAAMATVTKGEKDLGITPARSVESAATGMGDSTAAELTAHLKSYFRIPRFFDRVVSVVDSLLDLPPALLDNALADLSNNAKPMAFYYPADGRIYIFARYTPKAEAFSTLMHEAVHRAGATPDQITATQRRRLIRRIEMWALEPNNELHNQLARKAQSRVAFAEQKVGSQASDEILAYFVQEAIENGIDPTQLADIKSAPLKQWLTDLWRLIRRVLGELDILSSKLTTQDVVDVVYALAQVDFMTAPRETVGDVQTYNQLTQQPQRSVAASMAAADAHNESILQKLPKPASNWLRGAKNMTIKALQTVMFTEDLADFVGNDRLPELRKVSDNIFAKLSYRQAQMVRIQKVVEPVASWNFNTFSAFNKLLLRSTASENWLFEPTWLKKGDYTYDPNTKQAKAYREFLAKQTPEKAQEIDTVAKGLFKLAGELHAEMMAQLRKNIEMNHDDLISRATKDSVKRKREADKEKALREHDNRARSSRQAYLPMKRWGEWALVYKSPQYKVAEAAGNESDLRKMKADPKHYAVFFTDSEFAALQLRDALETNNDSPLKGVKIPDPYPRLKMANMRSEMMPFDTLQRLKEELRAGDDGVSSSVLNAVDRMYIEALEETSSRKSEMERMRVFGANEDMIQAFVKHGESLAALTASLSLHAESRSLVADMKTRARKSGDTRTMLAANEMLARYAHNLDYQPHPLIQKMMGGTSLWMLLSNPAYYIQNSTQPFMLTFPELAGRFGGAKSMAQMVRLYPEVLKLYRETKDGSLLDPALLTDPNEQVLFKELQVRGLLDVGIAFDLGSLQQSTTKFMQNVGKVHNKLVMAVRTVEVFNRGVTALAAYRLEYAKQIADNQPVDVAVDRAKQRARKVVSVTQGDYSGPNAPRVISMIPAGQLVTQFRKFQLIQIGLLSRVVYNSFKGASPLERTIARKQLSYLLGVHAVVGGALGLPAANIMGWALASMFGDKDEPENAELLARRYILNNGGNKEVADLLLRGLPAWAGLDASTRLGMGLTFSALPFTEVTASRDGAFVVAGSLLGPWMGAVARGVDGVGQIGQGNILPGIAQMLPSLPMNLLKAYDMHTRGINDRRGDTLMQPEEIGYLELVTQGMGWPNKTLSDRHLIRGFEIEVKQHFRDRATRLRRIYADAYDANDQARMDRAIEEWLRLQQMKMNYRMGTWQSVGDLTKAATDRMKREEGAIGGIATERTTVGFIEDMFM